MSHLLLLYAGLISLNTVVAAILWRIGRTSLHRDLFLLWASTVVAFVVQGATSQTESSLTMVLAFATVFLVNMALARLLAGFIPVAVPVRSSLVLFGVALGLSTTFAASGAAFWITALPVSVAVCWPLMAMTPTILSKHWGSLTFTGKAMTISSMLFVAHSLDYPFLRDKPDLGSMGFTIAILLVFALSVFAPAVVLELVAGREARATAELDVAHRIQMKLVPSAPKLPGLDISCYMKPADKVGGDYYDVLSFGGYSWILMGDVTGHGLGSGLVMLMAQSILSAILHTRSEITPSELNYLANKVLHQNLARLEEGRSMTIVAMSRAEDGGEFTFSGNHDGLFLLRADTGAVETLDVTQVPHSLGFLNEFGREEYGESKLSLRPGDTMFLATDGIVEAAQGGDYTQGMYSDERLCALLRETAGQPLKTIKQKLINELDSFTGGVFHDDVTFLLVRAQ